MTAMAGGRLTKPQTHTAPAAAFNPAEQQIVGLLPPGYSAAACAWATDPFPSAVASLDCSQNATSDSPATRASRSTTTWTR